jgi:signal transduction histidine kinase
VKQENIQKHLQTIDKKVVESDQIINNLLFYSLLKTPHFEIVSLYDLLNEYLESKLEQYAKLDITFELRFDALKDVLVKGDPLQLRELIANILNNAVDAVTACKEAAVNAGRVTITGEHNEFLELSILDNGVGIDEQYMDKLYEPFFSTKSKGTGLGLFVCHQIIALHGGTIDITSRKGEGTAVLIRLPLYRGTEPPAVHG